LSGRMAVIWKDKGGSQNKQLQEKPRQAQMATNQIQGQREPLRLPKGDRTQLTTRHEKGAGE